MFIVSVFPYVYINLMVNLEFCILKTLILVSLLLDPIFIMKCFINEFI